MMQALTMNRPAARRQLPMLWNSLALIGAKTGGMALGFMFWLLAARLFPREVVGVTAAVVSAMMLCTQLSLLGLGSSVITQYPRFQRRPHALLDSAQTLVVVIAALAAGLFLLLAGGLFTDLDVVASTPTYVLLFVVASVLGTLGVLLDQIFTAMRRGDQVLVRGLAFGIASVAALAAIAVASSTESSEAVFVPWVVGGIVTCSLGLVQLRRNLPDYRPRVALDRDVSRGLMARGLPNYALTLGERMPGLVLPVVVVELLSPRANAAWYLAWMMAWVVYFVPIQVGLNIFAEVAHEPHRLAAIVRQGVQTSLAVGAAGAVAVAALAHVVLSMLGRGYAADATTPLRILVIALIPLAFTYAYFSVCRATDRLREAIVSGWLLGLASVGAAAIVAPGGGLVGRRPDRRRRLVGGAPSPHGPRRGGLA
jgi:O-antigen/teichoic acid export membrane protein